MNNVLVEFNYNWADEFNVNSLWVTTYKEYQDLIQRLKDFENEVFIEVYYGENDFISFENTEEVLRSISIKDVSNEFASEFCDKIGCVYGLITLQDILNSLEKNE